MLRHLFVLLVPALGLIGCGNENILDPNDTDTEEPVDNDDDGSFSDEDCDDNDDEVYPGAPEFCGDGRITDCDRKDENGTITVRDEAFTELQDALDYADSGDEVLICPGTYLDTFTSPSVVVIKGLEGPDVTTVAGDGLGSTLTIRGGTEVEGVTITSGDAELGGGLHVLDKAGVVTRNVVIEGNTAVEGGGLYIPPGSEVELVDTTIQENIAITQGGGVYVDAGVLNLRGTSTILRNNGRTGGGVFVDGGRVAGGVISGNFALDNNLYGTDTSTDTGAPPPPSFPVNTPGGSGIAAFGRSSVVDVEISGNFSFGTSGGAVMVLQDDELTLSNCRVHSNESDTQGGGLEIRFGTINLDATDVFGNLSKANRGSAANIEGGTLSGNRTNTLLRDHAQGGAILLRDGTVEGLVIQNNTNALEGGGIQARGVVFLRNLEIVENSGLWGGGIFYVRDGAGPEQRITITDVTVRRNSASRGAGIYAGVAKIESSSVTDNQASEFGGGIYITRALEMTSGAVTDNRAPGGPGARTGGGLFYFPPSGEAVPDTPVSLDSVDMALPGASDNSPNDFFFQGTMGPREYDLPGIVTLECTPSDC